MRHIRARRHFKLILTLLLIMSSTLFAESRIESLIPRLKYFAETRIEEVLGNRFDVEIGKVEGGLITPLTLNDCKIKDPSGQFLFRLLDILSVRSNYRVWDLFSKDKGLELSIDINFVTKNKEITGFLRFDGDLDKSDIKGYVNLFGKERIDFSGKVHSSSFELDLKSRGGAVRAEGDLSDDRRFTVNLKTNHFKLYGFDIICDAVLKNKIINNRKTGDPASIEGAFETKNLILNYKPFPNVASSYRISGGVLDIASLRIENGLAAHGKISIAKPNNLDIIITADNANINQVLSNFGINDSSSIMCGLLNGKFVLRGAMKKPRLDAQIEISNGTISVVDFEHLSATLRGEGPIIRIEDSRITRKSGFFALTGEMDLRKIGQNSIFENIKISTDETALIWDGLNTKRLHGTQEVMMKKRMSDEVNLGFKKFIMDNSKIDESLRNTDEVEFEYRLHPNDSLKVMIGKDRDFFGLEHKDRF